MVLISGDHNHHNNLRSLFASLFFIPL